MNFKVDPKLVEILKNLPNPINEARVTELMDYCDGNYDDLQELFNLYFLVLEENLKAIQNSKKSSNNENLRTSSHKLKSSSKNVGFHRIGAICEWLENLSKSQGVNTLQQEIGLLEDECKKIKEISDKFLQIKKAA